MNTPQGWAQLDQRGSLEAELYRSPPEHPDELPSIMLTVNPSRPVPYFYALSPEEARTLALALLELANQVEAAGG